MKMLMGIVLLMSFQMSFAQQAKDEKALGNTSSFTATLKSKLVLQRALQQRGGTTSITMETPDSEDVRLNILFEEEEENSFTLVGDVNGVEDNSFYIRTEGSELRGNIILKSQKQAYEFYSDEAGNAYLREKPIDKVICIEYPGQIDEARVPQSQAKAADFEVAENVYDLQSLPGAYGVVLLDFDGYFLPAGTGWIDGNSLNAAPSGMSDAAIQEAWDLISEDFRPFNVNITTSQAVYDSYPQNRRQRCVFTPTNNAAPGAGGVAFVGGYGYQDWPCWVFILSGKSGGEAASHEIGHTLGLGHDGRTNPSEGYFRGHGDWAPIMGVGYYEPITQWSRGEYNFANNTEDDLSIMAGYIGFRGDDHGNNFGGSTFINKDGAGNINMQYGVIETTGDLDMFEFTCGTGNVTLDINTVARHGDLDVLVNLYEGSTGNLIGVFNGGGLNTRLEAYLDAGTYYIGVDGTGAGDPGTNGYSDYGSLGSFWISGTVPAGGNNGGSVVTVYENCNYGGYAVGLGVGSYNLADLQARGITNDEVSSIRVQSGYQATLYWDANFSGSSVTKTEDDACLVDDSFNDEVTSIVISPANSANVIEAESYSAMNGVQLEDCSEGGQNVGYIEATDWMVYNGINFPSSGSYLIEYRVASNVGGGRLSADINSGATVLGEVAIPNTGGWQNWQTVSHTVNVNAGTYPFGIYAQAGGWNINWIRITYQGAAAQPATSPQVAEASANLNTSLALYPNPVADKLYCQFAGEKAHITILNTTGQLMADIPDFSSGDYLELGGLESGVYLIKIQTAEKQITKRVVKK